MIVGAFYAQASDRVLFDDGWMFKLADSTTATDIQSPTMPNVDASWVSVTLPHDWSINGDFSADAPAGNDGGYLPTGAGWYSKSFNIIPDPTRTYTLLFDGVYMNSVVYVNDTKVGGHPYGYTTFACDITPALVTGDNRIDVYVDNSAQKNCRWYTGSGIYRNVWLLDRDKTHIAPGNIYITTPQVSDSQAVVRLDIDIDNTADTDASLQLNIALHPVGGTAIAAEKSLYAHICANASVGAFAEITLAEPSLWSPQHPSLYTADIEVVKDGKVVDTYTERFGIRKFEYSADQGLRLNGEPILLYGGCVHHDNGIIGAASYDAAEAYKVRALKNAGFNAVRTSHNPPSPAFLDECDRQGLIVIDEAFDGWRDKKLDHDYAELFDQWSECDLTAMVKRDRNHPSIFAWSVGNEVIERKKIEVVSTAKRLIDICHRLDPTRPVTSALASWDNDWEIYDPLADVHDIVGYNYMIHKAESDHLRVPERVMWQTESFPRDAFSNWAKVYDNSYILGDFVWTAIDYIGESSIGRSYYTGDSEGEHYQRDHYPWHGAYCGDIDITGWRKPISHYRERLFSPATAQPVYLSVREPDGYYGQIKQTAWSVYPTWESWDWTGHEGKPIDVEVISTYPTVRLYLNDSIVGEDSIARDSMFKAVFSLPYRPGTITAVGVDEQGNECADRMSLSTPGKPTKVRLTTQRYTGINDAVDLDYVVAEIVDDKGNVVAGADDVIEFSISGKAQLLGTGNGYMRDTDSYSLPTRKAYHGRAAAVVKPSGKYKLKARIKR